MSVCEDRITEDSTEFEKEFLKIYDGNLWTALDKMKDWQPPKPQQSLPVVPEDIDKAIKYLKTQNNFSTITDLQKLDILTEKGFLWLNDFQFKDRRFGFGGLNNKLFILSHLAITGYTVEKEKLYYLKHIEMSKHNDVDYWFSKKEYEHASTQKGVLPINFGWLMGYGIGYLQFTQSEIDDMKVGSYEQIEVKVEED